MLTRSTKKWGLLLACHSSEIGYSTACVRIRLELVIQAASHHAAFLRLQASLTSLTDFGSALRSLAPSVQVAFGIVEQFGHKGC